MRPLYFDHNATTPIAAEVLSAMLPYLCERFGNPASRHAWGLAAHEGLDAARARTAALIRAEPDEIVFTACATESNNTVLFGLVRPGERLVTSAIEHPSILEPAKEIARLGAEVEILPVDADGLVDPGSLRAALRRPAALVSVMLANNETGAIQPVAELARIARQAGALFHTDAAQAVGKIPVDAGALGVDFLTVAGHKLYAPKGIGALYVRRGLRLPPLLFGGGQERGLRSGTENVALAVGLAAACSLAARDLEAEMRRQQALGRALLQGLAGLGREFCLHAEAAQKLPNTLAIGFRGLAAERIVEGLALADVGVSAGAACHAGEAKISSVLKAMAVPEEFALGTIRFSWGRSTGEDDVRELVARLEEVLRGL
jgi:cysteine desulfurase